MFLFQAQQVAALMNRVTLGSRFHTPSKIVCIGRNYAAHIEELHNEPPEQPVIFIKPNSAIASQPCSRPGETVHYESEITLMILGGRIAGVGFGLDLTRRDLQADLKAKGLPWERAKAFDGAAVFIDFVHFTGDPAGLRLELRINEQLAQAGGVAQMLTRPAAILTEVAASFSLEDGDLIMTGTPQGVGPLVAGDRYHGRILDGERVLVEDRWVVQ
jgi:2-keto-4-pentenoate hydratase/2-oxohepta-3-ene-1,7-dioic acid hydratase in catechol pathway